MDTTGDHRPSRLETSLLESKLLTSDELREAVSAEQGLAGWIRRQGVLPDALLERAERGEPLRLGRYLVTGRLGKGGMGAVLRARDEALGRDVALKVVRPVGGDEPEVLRARFKREALALARLSHPGIVKVYDLEEVGDVMVLVLEHVPGVSVETRLRTGPLPERDARRMLRQVVQAMEAAESQGIVHRDLKPGNILWVPEGDIYKVCDFGLVRFREGIVPPKGDSGALTQAYTVIGTPFFMSPEQALGDGTIDARSDMYSLGLSMHDVLTKDVPFSGQRIEQVLRRRVSEDVPSVREKAPDVSTGLARVISWMTARDPKRRPPSWRALASDLAALEAGSQRLRRSGDGFARKSGEGSARLRRSASERAVKAPAPAEEKGGLPLEALVILALAIGAAVGTAAALLGR